MQAPAKSRYSALIRDSQADAGVNGDKKDEAGDDDLSEISEELDYEDDDSNDSGTSSDDSVEENDGGESEEDKDGEGQDNVEADSETDLKIAVDTGVADKPKRERKRKRKDDNEDLEANYIAQLTKDDEEEPVGKRQKADQDDAASDKSDNESEEEGDDGDNDKIPVHESVAEASNDSDMERAARTVFLANVSTEAISSKAARKTIIAHLSSALDPHDMPIQKFESIRFRSVAFSTGSMPKRAAYITKSLMGATTKSANAYAVFSSPAAARRVASKLNGSVVLDRHLRADSVAHPSPTDHRRCVFVGNLGFVDDETVLNTNQDGETVEKKRTKTPADVEEGLWRTFGKSGKVENVRVVRDSKTRVGKGFAYVQFYVSFSSLSIFFTMLSPIISPRLGTNNMASQDANDVEAALLLDGKKFPPMLPRKLRVARAKDPRKTALAQDKSQAKADMADSKVRNTKYIPKMTPDQQAAAGRAGRLFGKAGAHLRGKKFSGTDTNVATGKKVVFEGNRASINDGRPRDLKFGKSKKSRKPKPTHRSARRGTEWKKKTAAGATKE